MSFKDGSASSLPQMEQMLNARPELLQKYKDFYTTLCRDPSVPDRLRELCRLRVAAVHGCDAEWRLRDARVPISEDELRHLRSGNAGAFTDSEQAALSIAETLPFGQHQLEDDQLSEVRRHIGERGTVALLTECAFFDVVCRWKISFEIEARDRLVAEMPLDDGALA